MAEEFERFIKPIINASYPGTLAALSLAALQVGGNESPLTLKLVLSMGAMMFLFSAFFMFFYSIYPTRKKLWTGTAITFLLGLLWLIFSVLFLLIS
jgi:hypothetical protein